MSNTVWYRVPQDCPESWYETKTEFNAQSIDAHVREAIAADCARDYHEHHDGWVGFWPLTVAAHKTEGGPVLFSAVVEKQMEPRYSAKLISKD